MQKKMSRMFIGVCVALIACMSAIGFIMNMNKSAASGNVMVNPQTIAMGFGHTLAIQDGMLFAWGYNAHGQLGDGTNEDKKFPVRIGAETNWVNVTAGNFHSFAINELGELYACGSNYYGQLGDGTSGSDTSKNTPEKIGEKTNWVSIAAGNEHSLAINSLGELYAWGSNASGQLGDGTTTQRNAPVKIGAKTDWVSVSAGPLYNRSFAINALGELYAWGNNQFGTLGDGTTTQRNAPVKIGTHTNWVNVSAGNGHALAINSLGELYAWGTNSSGELGDGTNENKKIPVKVGDKTNWANISARGSHSLAINELGELYSWGVNMFGQLGDGTSGSGTSKNTPIKIGEKINWVDVSAGEYQTLAINEMGELYAWGENNYGQLGLGDFRDRNVPTPVEKNVAAPNSGTGYTVSQPSTPRVFFGGSYTFTITLSQGYDIPIVKLNTANGKLNLTSTDKNVYVYIVSNVSGTILATNFTVTVSSV